MPSRRDRREDPQGGAIAEPLRWRPIHVAGGIGEGLEQGVSQGRSWMVAFAIRRLQTEDTTDELPSLRDDPLGGWRARSIRATGAVEIPERREALHGQKEHWTNLGQGGERGRHVGDDLGRAPSTSNRFCILPALALSTEFGGLSPIEVTVDAAG